MNRPLTLTAILASSALLTMPAFAQSERERANPPHFDLRGPENYIPDHRPGHPIQLQGLRIGGTDISWDERATLSTGLALFAEDGQCWFEYKSTMKNISFDRSEPERHIIRSRTVNGVPLDVYSVPALYPNADYFSRGRLQLSSGVTTLYLTVEHVDQGVNLGISRTLAADQPEGTLSGRIMRDTMTETLGLPRSHTADRPASTRSGRMMRDPRTGEMRAISAPPDYPWKLRVEVNGDCGSSH